MGHNAQDNKAHLCMSPVWNDLGFMVNPSRVAFNSYPSIISKDWILSNAPTCAYSGP
jgi:hypothetical protein